jgi:hypothetical protein
MCTGAFLLNPEKTCGVNLTWSYSRTRLAKSHPAFLTAYSCVAAFVAYACMYALRKPFTAGSWTGIQLWGIDYKIILVIAQVLGYACSKFIGIRVISGMKSGQRALALLCLLLLAHLALLGFAFTPYPYNVIWMFVNGLPLGMIWGLVFGYLEGRRNTEILTAAISVNFIVSSGFVKSLGKYLLATGGVSESWMPFRTGLYFIPALLLSVWMLEQIPLPSEADLAARAPRKRMNALDRKNLWGAYAPGFTFLVLGYVMLTMIRDVRDNFAVEIWSDLGFSGQPAILTTAELPVAILTLAGLGGLMFIRDNYRALWVNHALCIGGAFLLTGTTLLFYLHLLGPVTWMILSGFGLFLPYIILNGMLFDRLLGVFKEKGNVGFLMYTADAFGYLSSVLILLWRNFGESGYSWFHFYEYMCWIGALLFGLLMIASWLYFKHKKQHTIPETWKTSST